MSRYCLHLVATSALLLWVASSLALVATGAPVATVSATPRSMAAQYWDRSRYTVDPKGPPSVSNTRIYLAKRSVPNHVGGGPMDASRGQTHMRSESESRSHVRRVQDEYWMRRKYVGNL
ncbi:hypothetical protein BCR44DRAFT_1439963 [Catenaria anguillulae PL171]|uniref:Uncharacterized protein n=1 Tax=Catenaria anguillulae PL171 TaxID=765915 RepID=A0A1Y2HHT6_9FUNG|nr:hypothetical protein BCR44DRAFT_1439963 [Catenaria anguillulae PL171]